MCAAFCLGFSLISADDLCWLRFLLAFSATERGGGGWWVVGQKCLVGRKFENWREVFANDWICNSSLSILVHPWVCSEGRRSAAQIKHLPNCRAGSFLSCVKSGRIERITWEHPLDSRWAAASSRQIWNKSLELCFRILNLLVKIYPPVAICVSRCKHCAELSGGILFEKHLMKHSPIHTGWYFWFILKGIACESMVCHDEMSLLLQDQIWIFLCDQIWRLPHHHPQRKFMKQKLKYESWSY